jgi:hypothetical protein
MFEILQGESGKAIVGMVAIVTVCGGPFIVGGLALWLHHRKNERLADLKQEMVERGMSADEIVRVLNAGSPSGESSPKASSPPAGG